MTTKQTAALLMYLGLALCAVAVVLGTRNAMRGDWEMWALDCIMFIVAAGCTIANYKMKTEV